MHYTSTTGEYFPRTIISEEHLQGITSHDKLQIPYSHSGYIKVLYHKPAV